MVISWDHHTTKDIIMPSRAVVGGKDVGGEFIYCGRATYQEMVLPAKIVPEKKACYVTLNGLEIPVDEFEVLCGDHHKFKWEPASNGNVVPNAVATGKVNGEELYIGRAVFEGAMVVGQVSESKKCLLIAFDGREHSIPHYEILTYHPRRRSRIAWGSFGEIVLTE